MRLFNAPERALALVGAEPREAAGGVVNRLERALEHRRDVGGRGGHREDVFESDRAGRKAVARRHQAIEHQRQEVAPRREGTRAHARRRIMPSAM